MNLAAIVGAECIWKSPYHPILKKWVVFDLFGSTLEKAHLRCLSLFDLIQNSVMLRILSPGCLSKPTSSNCLILQLYKVVI